MSRPKDLPSVLQTWASGNYGVTGHSWDSTPKRAAPGGTELTPGTTLAAEVENYLHGNAFDATQGAVNAVGQIPALNWFVPFADLGAVTIGSLFWSDFEQTWYAIRSSSTNGQRSQDYGRRWVTYAIANANGIAGAVDTSGNAVIADSDGSVQDGTFNSYGSLTWASHAGVIINAAGSAFVAWDPANSLWCILADVAGGSINGYTSTNRSTWTSRSIPATWSGFSGNVMNGGMTAANSILVACFVDSTTTFRTMRSTNGGVSWANDQAITVNAGITLSTSSIGWISRPMWSPTDQLWYIAVNQTSTRKTQIFSSPDAITWSNPATLLTKDMALLQLGVLGSLIVGMNNDGRIFASVNKGVNWYLCGNPLTTQAPTDMIMGGGGLMLLSKGATSYAMPSSRFGLPTQVAA